jgi:membrane-associated phospholipid phosphatase
MKPAAEAKIQQKLAQSPGGQRLLFRRTLGRAEIVVGLLVWLGLSLAAMPPPSLQTLLFSLIANQWLIALLFGFGLIALSLLWSVGQRLDVAVFAALNLRGYHSVWMDREMGLTTHLGNIVFAALLAAGAYAWGDWRFATNLLLGTLTLWLSVELIKASTDRARPFNLLRETRVIGLHEPGLSFPSGHTAQTFFVASLALSHFHAPLGIAIGLYVVAALVAFTRIYVGAHYPRDVIAGAILGMVWGILIGLVQPNI